MEEVSSPIIMMIVLIILEGFITSVETSIHFINENNVKKRALEGDRRSKLLLEVLEMPYRYKNGIEGLLAGTNIILGVLVAITIYFQNQGVFTLQTVLYIVATIFIVTLTGNVIPKKLGVRYSENIAFHTIYILRFLLFILSPFISLLESITKLFLILFRIDPKEIEDNVTEEEIISIVNEGHEQGVLEKSEVEMISNIISFDEKEVKDIMTHRKKIISVDVELSVEEALKLMVNGNYSRYPLYEEDIDNIIGIIHLKDVTRHYMSGKNKHYTLKDIAREPYFIPDTQSIGVLFNDMQLKKVHMAIAIDEYGQTAGLIAMEDILEEIVGNILDEYDVDEKMIIKQGNRYIIKGMANLDEIEEVLGIEFDQEEYDTLNGFLISILDRIPADGENVKINYKGFIFHIVDVKNKMIRFVRVSKEIAD